MLTQRQRDLLSFIIAYQQYHGGASPTFREMVRGIGARSNSQVSWLLEGLKERGFVRTLHNRARATEVLAYPDLPRKTAKATQLLACGFCAAWTAEEIYHRRDVA